MLAIEMERAFSAYTERTLQRPQQNLFVGVNARSVKKPLEISEKSMRSNGLALEVLSKICVLVRKLPVPAPWFSIPHKWGL